MGRHLSALASQSQVVAGGDIVVDGCIRGSADPKGGKAENISEWLQRHSPNCLPKL